jgi:hypothetical protein
MSDPDEPLCKLQPALIVRADGSKRAPTGGWTYAHCANCPLRVWVAPGTHIAIHTVCPQKVIKN